MPTLMTRSGLNTTLSAWKDRVFTPRESATRDSFSVASRPLMVEKILTFKPRRKAATR
jgi:hypothetical protein